MSDQHTTNVYDVQHVNNTGDNVDHDGVRHTNDSDSLTRKKDKQKIGTHKHRTCRGHEYELKTFTWIALCAFNNPLIDSFSMAANVDGIGSWDDIIIKYLYRYKYVNKQVSRRCFVQTKFKHEQDYKINKEHLSSEKGSFSIKKLFSSFTNIQKNYLSPEILDDKPYEDTFIVYTTAGIDDSICNNSQVDCILSKDFNTGDIVSICEAYFNNDKEISKHIDKKINIFSSQGNIEYLDCIIKNCIAQIFQCSEFMADWITLKFIKKMQLCFESCYFVTKVVIQKLLLDAKDSIIRKIDNDFNYRLNNSSGSLPIIDEISYQYMQQALKATLTINDLASLNNFQSVETAAGDYLKDLYPLNYGKKVSRPAQFLNSYYTALWLTHNLKTNRDFLLRKLFQLDFQAVKKQFDEILAHGSELHNAVLRNDVKEVQHIVNMGVDVNIQDIGGRTPLHLVGAQNSNTDKFITHILLENGANVNIIDRIFNWTPLQYADFNHSWIVIAMILEFGGCINDLIFTSHTICNNKGCDALLNALKVGGYKFVSYLIENSTTIVNGVLTEDGLTPLHVAAQYGHLPIVKFLCENGAKLNVPDNDKRTPLFVACENNHKHIEDYLYSMSAKELTVA